jgi:winged helix DNA-binding protein
MAPIARRLSAQLLSGPPARSPEAVVERLLAVQGQDPRGARLAIRARTRGLTAADVDRALSERRTLLITWVNRGTLHLIRREDYPWLHALTTPPLLTGNARRLAQEGVSPDAAERGVAVIERAVAAEGPLTRAQLARRVAAAGVRTERQAMVHLLMLASLRGLVVRGPMAGVHHAYARVEDWLPEVAAERGRFDRDRALAELARRYLAGHAPASDRDLAKWAGLPLRDARAGLGAIAGELEQCADGLVALRGAGRAARKPELPPPRLLGAFDAALMGWASRAPLLGEHDARVVSGGLFRPVALVRGRAAALWRLADGEVVLEPFGRLRREDDEALTRDGRDVVRFLGGGALSGRASSRARR